MPGRLKMRTTGQQHQEGRGWCLIYQQIQPFKGCGISPVQVFQDEQYRLRFGKFLRLSGIFRGVKLLYYQLVMSTYQRAIIRRSESSGAPDL